MPEGKKRNLSRVSLSISRSRGSRSRSRSRKTKRIRAPRVAILAITTHGGIHVTPQKQTKMFAVPEGKTVIKVTAVPPGVCHFASSEDTDKSVKGLIKHMRSDFLTNPDEFLAKSVSALKQITKVTASEQVQPAKKARRKNEADPLLEQFIRHSDKAYQVSVKEGGEEMIDKYFSLNNEELAEVGPYDLKILLLSEPGYPDLMREINGRHSMSSRSEHGDSSVYLSKVLSHLFETRKYDIAMCFDITCSALGNFEEDTDFTHPDLLEDMGLTEREISILRRALLSENLHGGAKHSKNTTLKR